MKSGIFQLLKFINWEAVFMKKFNKVMSLILVLTIFLGTANVYAQTYEDATDNLKLISENVPDNIIQYADEHLKNQEMYKIKIKNGDIYYWNKARY